MIIGPVDTEIALLRVKNKKKEEISEGKIYSPFGKFAEQAKQIDQVEFEHYRSNVL